MNFSASISAHSASQKPKSTLDLILQIREGGGTPAEKRQLIRALQDKLEGERVQKLMVSIKKEDINQKEKSKEQANEDGDTVLISQSAQAQFEQSDSHSSTELSSSSETSVSVE